MSRCAAGSNSQARLTADISDFTPGVEYAVGHADRPFGTFICYEAIFPNEIRRFAANGAELLINISNDGWFGRSAAPAQHLMMSRVRAVESRRWMLRDTNNGFTVSVDPYGRIVARLPTDIRGELEAPYDFRSDITPYVRFGDWLCWLSLLVSIGILGLAFASDSLNLQHGSNSCHSERSEEFQPPNPQPAGTANSHFPFSLFHFPRYSIPMPEHIEDIQHRYIDLKKRMELVRSYL